MRWLWIALYDLPLYSKSRVNFDFSSIPKTNMLKYLLAAVVVDTRLAMRNIARQTRRSLIAIVAIGFGVIAMMLAAGFIEWVLWANREGVAVTQLGHIQIVKPGYYDDGKANPFAYLLPQQSPALKAVQDLAEVASVTPRLDFNGLVSHGENTLSFIGQGMDPSKDPSMQYLIIVDGKQLTDDDPKGILIGAGLAANLGAKVGDTVVLLTGTRTGGLNAIEVRVCGLASTSMKAYDDTMLRVPIALARQLLRVPGAHVWVTSLRDTRMTESVTRKIQETPSLKPYEIAPWTKLADFYNKTVELLNRQISVVQIIIAVIIVLSISNTMTMSVMERTVEIGTAMALGVRRRRILGLFLLEGTLLGIIAGLGGAALGYLLATGISMVGIPMPPAPGMSRGFTARIMISPRIIWEALTLAIAATLLASAYPAWRASRLEIVDALRHVR
jgi:putative ABC transport system permease protein